MQIKYLGHSAFEIETQGRKILIDPFLVMSQNYNPSGVTDIFVTHAHSDHLGNAIEISKRTGAVITAIFELANYCSSKGAKTRGINLCGYLDYGWGKVAAVPAFHSSLTADGVYGGCPCGYVFKIEDKVLYHSGDTCINSEMKTIGEVYHPELVMLPIGGTFTMDIENSVLASEWLKAAKIIPMHYNTFGAINVNIEDFKNKISSIGKTPVVLNIGGAIQY